MSNEIRLAEIKARAEEAQWTSMNAKQAMTRMSLSAADVPWLVEQVERLTADRDAAIERLERVIDQWRKTGRAVISEMNRADKAEAERDALAAQVARIKALADEWRYKGEFGWGPWQSGEGPDPEGYVLDHCASALRAALAGSEADTNDTQPTDSGAAQ